MHSTPIVFVVDDDVSIRESLEPLIRWAVMKTIGIACRRRDSSSCSAGPLMPGMAMSRIRHLV